MRKVIMKVMWIINMKMNKIIIIIMCNNNNNNNEIKWNNINNINNNNENNIM